MKKFLSIIVAIVLGSLCCFLLCSCDDSWQSVEQKLKHCDTHLEWDADESISVYVDSSVASVYLRKNTDDNKITVDYLSNNLFDVNGRVWTDPIVDSLGFILQVSSTQPVGSLKKEFFVIVGIPQNTEIALANINTSVGSVHADEFSFGVLKVETTTGSINLGDCDVAATATLSATTGSIKANLDAAILVATTETGSIRVEGDISETALLHSETGSVFADVDTRSLGIDVGTGTVQFEADALIITIRVGTGSVTGTVQGNKELYSISTTTGTGSSNLQNQDGDKLHWLTVTTDTGSINIKFENQE